MRLHAVVLGILLSGMSVFAESAGGISWTAPVAWENQGSRPMRAATYTVSGDGECAVYYFGPGQGGSVEANVQRWIGQFEAEGKPATAKRTVNGVAVTTIDVSGVYLGAGGPMAPGKIRKPGYRMLAAIAEGPEGNVFFKFTGPKKTIAAEEDRFEKMIGSLGKTGE